MILREVLAFREPTLVADTAGGRSTTWATVDTIRGKVRPLSTRESLQAGALGSRVRYLVTVRRGQLEAAAVSVSTITRSSATATVTTATDHGLTSGDYVTIRGADQAEYNARVEVTVTAATTYTYTVTGTPASPATGTITSARLVPLDPSLAIAWTPSEDSAQASTLLEILGVRGVSPHWTELDCAVVT